MDGQKRELVSLRLENGTARIQNEGEIPVGALDSLAWSDDSFWGADAERGIIYRFAGGGSRQVIRAYPQYQRHPAALFLSQDSLWAAEPDRGIIDKYLLSRELTGISIASVGFYSLPAGIVPAAIYIEGNTLWVLDSAANSIRRYAIEGLGLRALDSADLTPLLPAGCRAQSMLIDNSSLWLLAASPAQLERLSLKSLRWKPSLYRAAK